MLELNNEQMIDLLQYSFIRMDGAWFLALAKNHDLQTAWDADVEAWKQFSYLFGKRLRQDYIPDPVWPESFLDAIATFSRVLKIEGRKISLEDERIIVRVTECETQKAIAKANVADCGIVTVYSYQGLAKGLFNKEIDIEVQHTQNLNHGDPCCEVIISKKNQAGSI